MAVLGQGNFHFCRSIISRVRRCGWIFSLVWAGCLALSACARGPALLAAPPLVSTQSGKTPAASTRMPVVSTNPSGLASPTPTGLEAVLATAMAEGDDRPSGLALPTPTAPPEAFRVCSPLAEHAIQDLAAIVSAPYAPPPENKPEERHHGVDFAYYRDHGRDSILGEGVKAVLGGKVAMALEGRFPYGNAVIVETPGAGLPAELAALLGLEEGQSLYLLYAHLGAAPEVALGEEIEPCRRLGEAGLSGNAGAPHLHLEARVGPAGAVFESMAFYQLPLTPEEMAAYTRWRTGGEFRHFDPMILVSGEWQAVGDEGK